MQIVLGERTFKFFSIVVFFVISVCSLRCKKISLVIIFFALYLYMLQGGYQTLFIYLHLLIVVVLITVFASLHLLQARVSRTGSRPGDPEAGPRRFGGRGRSGLTL